MTTDNDKLTKDLTTTVNKIIRDTVHNDTDYTENYVLQLLSLVSDQLKAKDKESQARVEGIFRAIEERWGTPFDVELDTKWWQALKAREGVK